MPNPTQADVVGSAALHAGGMGTLGARAEISVLSPNKVRQA